MNSRRLRRACAMPRTFCASLQQAQDASEAGRKSFGQPSSMKIEPLRQTNPLRSVHRDAGTLDGGVHFAISRSTSICKYSGERRSALTLSRVRACDRGGLSVHGFARHNIELRHDCCRGAFRQKKATPGVRLEIGKPLLMGHREFGHELRAIACKQHDSLHRAALNLRQRAGRVRAHMLNLAMAIVGLDWEAGRDEKVPLRERTSTPIQTLR
jgi:hypothetical protein